MINKCLILLLILSGCTDAGLKQLSTYGSNAIVQCFSGGKLIYLGESTGKVLTENESDGWYFQEKGSNKLIRVSADCVIRN